MNEMTTPAAGHNRGHVPTIEEIQEVLGAEHSAILERRDELLAGFERAPQSIDDEEVAGKVSDFVRQFSAAIKAAENARTASKEPYLAGGRAVDGFFKPVTDSLKSAKSTLTDRITAYQRRKAEAERQAREQAEREAREAAEAARKAAEEAEAAVEKDEDLDAAIAAEQRAKEARDAAATAERLAQTPAAELSRTRGDHGAVSSLRSTWVGELVDRSTLDLDALREHLPRDAIDRAINAFVKAGGRELRGAKIYEKQSTVVR